MLQKMKIDETQLDTVRRGDLLEVAQFLTDFKSHFCYKDLLASPAEASRTPSAAKSNIISPVDVSNALEYRQILNSRDDLEQEYYVSTQQELPTSQQRQRHFGRRHREGLKDSMDKLQVQLDKRPEREKIIHQLLLRFEIWTTKVIAQQVLISPSGEIDQPTDSIKPCCYSPFLNLPSAKHFYSIMPPATGELPSSLDIPSALHQYKPSCCCLPLPPNRQTWKEFAKFVQILGILDPESLQKAKSSPCCVTNLTHGAGQKRNHSLAQDFQYQGHDLVPLWIRAKRNSQAMRQLWTLFTILPDSEGGEEEHLTVAGTGQRGSGKQIVAGLANPHPKSTSFKAVLQNNPKHRKSRAMDVTKLVDQLVEWAVVNQVVFTYRHMRACIQAGPQGKRRAQQLSGLYQQSAKRPRVEQNAHGNDAELMHACRAYVLRWFARRNRRVATVLFASNQDNLHLDAGCSRVDRVLANLLKDKVEEGIRHYLERPEVSDITAYRGDRTLARIDRRLFIPGRYDSDINMASQVLTLLQALGESAPGNQMDPALVQSAKSDFQEMYDHFFGDGKDAYDTARKLLDVDTESTADLAAILRSAPLPWVDKCCVCEAGPNERQLRTCANCEGVYHTKCSPPGKMTVRLADAVRAYAPLRDLYKLKLPADVPAPDFRSSSPSRVKWTTKIVTVDRPLRDGGSPMPLGLMLRHTEECRGAFEALRSEECLVSDLAEMINVDKKASRNTFPLAIDHIGYIITEVFGEQRGDFCGRKAGLEVGDVIMALEILSFADLKQASQYKVSTTYTFANLDVDTRLDLLKQKTTKLKMMILRPSQNVVKNCTEWYTRIKRANKTLCTAFVQSVAEQESEARLWFCGNCVTDRPTEETRRESATILQEALVCRAVIRRLAIESYSLPFIDENPDANEALSSQEKSHSKFVSLRRLDNMMTSIIEDHNMSDKSTEDPNSLISKTLRNAFCVPPWAAGGMCRQRLDWASEDLEKQPMALLCRGIVHLFGQHGQDANDTKKEEKKALSRHFLPLFCAWCVSMTSRGADFPSTKGPSKVSLQARAPWLHVSCSECMSRSADGADSGFQICDNATCLSSSKEQGAGTELMGREEVLTIANATESYMHCASFVGASFLVLPEDPLVEAVSKVVPIDHDDRPVEFVVASYLPPDVVQGMKLSSRDDILDKFKTGDGVYHILPVVSFQQLKFLLDRCQTRNPPRKVEIGHDDYSWTALDVLNLEGVARFSPAEFQNRISEHAGIRDAIDRAVVDKGIEASVSISDGSTTDSRRILDSRSFMSSQKLLSDADDPLPQYRHLIESLIYDASHVFRDMAPTGNTESLSNAPLDFERDFGEVPGGEKGCKRGFDIIIPASIPSSSGILQPEAVAENRCAVAYSDFYFESPTERASLEDALRGQTLSVPPLLVVMGKKVAPAAYSTIILNRVENPTALDSFKGIGWGVEIIQWKGEPALRIGRVCQPSTAHDAGLRTHDVLVEVSGSSPSDIGSQVDLICSFLGVTCRIPCKDYGLGAITRVLSTIRSADIALESVVLVVYRQPPLTESEMLNGVVPPSTESDVMTVDENGEANTPALDSDCEVVDVRNGAVKRSKRPHSIAAPHPIGTGNMAPVMAPVMAPLARSSRNFVDSNSSRRMYANNDASPSPNIRESSLRWNTDNGSSLPHEWSHLYLHLTSNLSTRAKITSKDLYRPGISGMVFTFVETAVFCECVRQLQPLLGMRLLCPRYDVTTIFKQTAILKKALPNLILTIPVVPDTIYWRLLRLDFQRASSTSRPETGDPIFFEGAHQYRMPVDRLPLDRYVESLFQDETKQTRQQQVPLQPVPLQQQQQQPHYGLGANGRYGGEAAFPQNNQSRSQPYRVAPMNGYRANSQMAHSHSADRNVTSAPNGPSNHAYDNRRSSHASESMQGRRDGDVERYLSDFAVPDGSPQPESTLERIRGGGHSSSMDDPKSGEGTSLDKIPPDDWRHQPVYSKVQTSNEGVYSEATLVGFVKAPKSSGAVRGKLDKAEIEAHYLSNIGYFDEARTFEIESNSLFLIDTSINTEESRVVLKLQARNLGPKTSRDRPSRTKNPEDTQPSVEESAKIRGQLVDMTLSFMRRLGEMAVLGELPDGRDVIWLRSDPRALYVRLAKDQSCKEDLHQRAAARAQKFYLRSVHKGDSQRLRISRSKRPQHFCVWGCSVKATSLIHETLSFDSDTELEEHYLRCHSFCSTADITTLGDYGQFLRIQDGRHILELSAAMTSAICARRLSLIDEAVTDALQPETIPNGKVFYRSPQDLHLSFHLTQRFRAVVLELLKENDPALCRPINLWSRIARLFVLEEEGQFRLNPTEYQEEAMSSQINVFSPGSGGRVLACSCERTSTPDTEFSASGNFECGLCALQWEKVTRLKRKDPPKIPTTDNVDAHHRSIGCALLSDASYPERLTSEVPSIPGRLGQAKSLLLKVALHMPEPLRNAGGASAVADPLVGYRIWNEDYFEVWSAFAKEATNTRMLAQALVAMLASIHRARLPRWWSSEGGGWSTAQALVEKPTLSAFFLHLYVLDAAIAEFMSTAYLKESTGKRIVSGSLAGRMEKYHEYADKLGFKRFSGAHEELCCFCDDGGSLLCCDLCENVQHHSCCDPPIENPDVLSTWICDSCINDINVRSKHLKDQGAPVEQLLR
jgi:hypothetical protein